MSVVDEISKYIMEKNIKQTVIADKCGWTKQKMNAIIRGRQGLKADEFGEICNALDVPYDYFYTLADENKPMIS